MSKTPALMRGKFIVYFIVALAILLAAYLLIFKPGPMSAEKVAHAKQRALFGEESDFRISRKQLETMSQSELDSAIVLFNKLLRLQDSVTVARNELKISKQTDAADIEDPVEARNRLAPAYAKVAQLMDRSTALIAQVDLLAGKLNQSLLVDSLLSLAEDDENYAFITDPTADRGETGFVKFRQLLGQLYEDPDELP